MDLVTKASDENLEKNNFTVQANKLTENLDWNLDTNLIANLLKNINEEFPEDNAFFLLNILIEKYSGILNSYCSSCKENKDKTIFCEIDKIKKESELKVSDKNKKNIKENWNKNLKWDNEMKEEGKKLLKLIEINEKTYFQKYDFIRKLSKKYKEILFTVLEWKNKKDVQEYILKLEEFINKQKETPIKSLLINFWKKINSKLEITEEDLKILEEKIS